MYGDEVDNANEKVVCLTVQHARPHTHVVDESNPTYAPSFKSNVWS